MFARIALALLLGVFTFSIAACETTEGAGRDIQRGGEAIEDTAEDVQD